MCDYFRRLMFLIICLTADQLGVALLPFVDEKRLLGALATVYDDLTDEESELGLRPLEVYCF